MFPLSVYLLTERLNISALMSCKHRCLNLEKLREKQLRPVEKKPFCLQVTLSVIDILLSKLIHQKMVEQGFTVVRPPTRVEVPGRGEVYEMMSRDPDGQIVNLSLRGPLR